MTFDEKCELLRQTRLTKEITYEERLAMLKLRYGVCTHTHTHTHKRKFTAEQIAEWNKRQLEINFDDYDKEWDKIHD